MLYSALSDSTPTNPDEITDFVHGTDRIDLSALDANASARGNQAFRFGRLNEDVVANSVTYYESEADTFIQADVNGDTTADFVLVLEGTNLHLSAFDLLL